MAEMQDSNIDKQLYSFDIDEAGLQDNMLSLGGVFCFVLVAEGKADVAGMYGRHTIAKGDLLITTPNIPVSLGYCGERFRASCISMSPAFFDALPDGHPMYIQLAGFIARETFPIFHIEDDMFSCLSDTVRLCNAPSWRFTLHKVGIARHIASVFLLEIAGILNNVDTGLPVCVRRQNEIFCRFRDLLAEHHSRWHSVSFYADRLHISSKYLSSIVKRITGRTVCDHKEAMLLADARRMLECSNLEIKEISDSLGFSDQSAFSKFFKSRVSISPAFYRAHPEAWQDKGCSC